VESFPSKISELQTLWAPLQNETFSKDALIELAAFCHKIAGSSGSYEFLEISQAANSVEEYCHSGFSNTDQNAGEFMELHKRYQVLIELLKLAEVSRN